MKPEEEQLVMNYLMSKEKFDAAHAKLKKTEKKEGQAYRDYREAQNQLMGIIKRDECLLYGAIAIFTGSDCELHTSQVKTL